MLQPNMRITHWKLAKLNMGNYFNILEVIYKRMDKSASKYEVIFR